MAVGNFLDWLTAYEHEKQMMKIVRLKFQRLILNRQFIKTLLKEKEAPQKHTSKAYKRKIKMFSRSNVLRKIIDCLEDEGYQHMLNWDNKAEGIFTIKFVHMNNPEFKKADYLKLFKELDKLSNSYKKYLKDKKYNHNCKVRCKANLRKLVDSCALTYMGSSFEGKSIELRTYKLNYDASRSKSVFSRSEQITKSFKVINILVSAPFGGISILNARPSLSASFCTTENGNEYFRNAVQPLTAYQHEKPMDKNNGILPIVRSEDSVESESVGKSTFPYYFSHIEEAKEDINLASPYGFLENEMQYSNYSSNDILDKNPQDEDGESKNFAQMVPCSPQNLDGLINEVFPQWYGDYSSDTNKAFQLDNDPFWSVRMSDCLDDNLLKENEPLKDSNEARPFMSSLILST